jgi:phosphatidylserine/phosphatidylglycerophosphate/cardiolipin synthase-like enzyme
MRMLALATVLFVGCGSPNGDATDGGTDGAPHGDGGTNADASTILPVTQSVQIIVEPNGNHASELVTAINGATTSVYMTMYQIDNSSIINAIVARQQAGLDVAVILDGSTQCKSFNTSAYNTFLNAGISVVWSNPSFTYTHEKTVILDGTSAWIMTMNANVSPPSSNREYLAIDTDAGDVAEATAVFRADHSMHAVTPSGNLVVADSNARSKLVQLIASATTTLDLEGEEFSDTNSNGVVSAVAAAARRGVTVHVVIGNSTPNATAITTAKNAGAHIVVTGPTSNNGTTSHPYIHSKAVLVDCSGTTCARGFVGSENFSAGSLGYNRELGVIFDTKAELAKVKSAIDTDFAAGVAQ